MDDHPMPIPDTTKTAKGRRILVLQRLILDLDIQSPGEIFKLGQKFFTVHGFSRFIFPKLSR
jgi:hypothetical protein